MNARIIISALAIIVALFTSCKKNDHPQPVEIPEEKAISGIWVGKYGNGAVSPDKFFAVEIKKDGTLILLDETRSETGTGTWELEEQTFKAVYSYHTGLPVQYYLGGKYKEEELNITGDWGTTEALGSGKFFIDKE